MDDIEPKITRTDYAHLSIQIGTIHVEKRTGIVHDLCYLLDIFLEKSECIRIREHHGCRFFIHQLRKRLRRKSAVLG